MTIDSNAFSYNNDLTSIVIPNTVKKMGNGCLASCKNLESVVLSSSVGDQIGWQVLYDCHKLKSVIIPEGVTTIPMLLFASCFELENLSFPSTINVFSYKFISGCSNIKELRIHKSDNNIIQFNEESLTGNNNFKIIFDGTMDVYKSFTNWNNTGCGDNVVVECTDGSFNIS